MAGQADEPLRWLQTGQCLAFAPPDRRQPAKRRTKTNVWPGRIQGPQVDRLLYTGLQLGKHPCVSLLSGEGARGDLGGIVPKELSGCVQYGRFIAGGKTNDFNIGLANNGLHGAWLCPVSSLGIRKKQRCGKEHIGQPIRNGGSPVSCWICLSQHFCCTEHQGQVTSCR